MVTQEQHHGPIPLVVVTLGRPDRESHSVVQDVAAGVAVPLALDARDRQRVTPPSRHPALEVRLVLEWHERDHVPAKLEVVEQVTAADISEVTVSLASALELQPVHVEQLATQVTLGFVTSLVGLVRVRLVATPSGALAMR